MGDTIRSKIPLLFLICVSIGWSFYYQNHNVLNDYGNANFEWLFLLDALIALPIICFFCIKNKKEAFLKAVVLGCFAILIGSYIIPSQNKLIWHYLESGRYVVIAAIILFELVAISTVYLAIRAALSHKVDPDVAIEMPIKNHLGEGFFAKLLCLETRMWTYAIFAKQVTLENFMGEQHFTYHQKDGAKSNLLGFILLIIFEVPVVHLLLHFVWSPFVANMVTLLTIFGLIFFVAEYRAISRRPISLVRHTLCIRYGLYQPLVIPLSNIATISESKVFIRRSKLLRRYNYSGYPNVVIELREPIGVVQQLFIGVDNSASFISSLQAAKFRDKIDM